MDNEFDIAIVGLACRFPGARDADEFWRNLDGGVESIARLTDEQLLAAGVPRAVLGRSDYVKAAPTLDDADKFDAGFFSYSPAEAAGIDPQQRVLLELAHLALEDAACDPTRFKGRVGLFAGSAMNTYFMRTGLEARFAESYIPTLIGNDKDFLATRISYKLGLRGPSITVQTACSTSLVAIHLARQSLLNQETDLALAGAVSVRVPLHAGYFYDGSGVVSPDGHVRAFDAAAGGTVFGSGAGILVLKRLADALASGDPIHAVIRGSAVNNDGSEKAGFTAPSVDGQADAVVEALANAGVDAADISFLEAHGSGTPVGDRIELLALTKAFRKFTQKRGYCAIGSVKTNVGHLDASAGVAAVIKTVLALKHGRIPATLHYERANEGIDFPGTPFFVNSRALEWTGGPGPRRAAVMSTGMGGTNSCLVLEEAPGRAEGGRVESPGTAAALPELLTLSAKTPAALEAMSTLLANFLESNKALTLGSVARTLQLGRRAFAERRYLVCRDTRDAVALLRAPDTARSGAGTAAAGTDRPIVLLLPGVGDQYVGMGRGLYERFPIFKAGIDRCAELLREPLGVDIRDVLYPAIGGDGPTTPTVDLRRMLARGDAESPGARAGINETLRAQPILFSVEYALARLWMSWGVQPTHLVGHSMGEYVAACLSGVFSLPDALTLIATRAKLVSALPEGAMVAVMLSEGELLPMLGPELSISLINGPKLCVVAGPVAAMAAFRAQLDARQAIYRAVRNAHAFHSRMLDPIAAPFAAEVAKMQLGVPRIPFISNVTGTWITPDEARNPEYWADHARRTARFGDALEQLWKLPECALIEAGPGRTLGVLALQHPARPGARRPLSVASLRSEFENVTDAGVILKGVGQLWAAGGTLDWAAITPAEGRPAVSLPGYPFERARHWIDAPPAIAAAESDASAPTGRLPLDDWTYLPSWQRCDRPGARDPATPATWVLLGAESDFSKRLAAAIRLRGETLTASSAPPGEFGRFLAEARNRRAHVVNVAYFVSADRDDLRHVFNHLLDLALAIDHAGFNVPVRLGVITTEMNDVTGCESLDPRRQMSLGPVQVVGKEYPNICSFAIDLPPLAEATADPEALAHRVLEEFRTPVRGSLVALRGGHRWEPSFRPQKLPPPQPENLRPRGVYLITGGTGGVGLAIARHLAKACQARLILTRKSAFSPNAAWRQKLALEIEGLGGTVEVHTCDVADATAMKQLLDGVMARHGAVHGIVHAAGVLRDSLISMKTELMVEAVLTPKVEGTRVLFEAISGLGPDFTILFSSLASIAPFAGQSDYCSANAYLDAVAQAAAKTKRYPVTSINWPVWEDIGMSARAKSSGELARILARRTIAAEEGVEIFRRCLAGRFPQVVVSPVPIDSVLRESTATVAAIADADAAGADEADDEVEPTVEKIWAPLLGVPAPIDHRASFFNLGGHSLLAMQVVSQIRATYQVNFTLRKFFEAPTISGNAEAIRSEILAEIENLGDGVPETASS